MNSKVNTALSKDYCVQSLPSRHIVELLYEIINIQRNKRQQNIDDNSVPDFMRNLNYRMKSNYNLSDNYTSSIIDFAIENRLIIKQQHNNTIRYKLNYKKKEKAKRTNDWCCFYCHSKDDNTMKELLINCNHCWRSFHSQCAQQSNKTPYDSILCDYCKIIKSTDPITDGKIQLKDSLIFLVNYCEKEIYSETKYRELLKKNDKISNCVVFKKFDINLIKFKADSNTYPTNEAFEHDFNKHFSHNFKVSYFPEDKEYKTWIEIEKFFNREVNDLKLCAQCYEYKRKKKYTDKWFVKPCSPPHQLVYAMSAGFSYWPAKLIAAKNDDQFHVKWFNWPHDDCLVRASKIRPIDHKFELKHRSYKKNKKIFDTAQNLLRKHIELLREKNIEPAIILHFGIKSNLNKVKKGAKRSASVDCVESKSKRITNYDANQITKIVANREKRVKCVGIINNSKALIINIDDNTDNDSKHSDDEDSVNGSHETDKESDETCTVVDVNERTNHLSEQNIYEDESTSMNITKIDEHVNRQLFDESDSPVTDGELSLSARHANHSTYFENNIDLDYVSNLTVAAQTSINTNESIGDDRDDNDDTDKLGEENNGKSDTSLSDCLDKSNTNLNHINHYEDELKIIRSSEINSIGDISSVESDCFDEMCSDEDSVTFIDIVTNACKLDKHHQTVKESEDRSEAQLDNSSITNTSNEKCLAADNNTLCDAKPSNTLCALKNDANTEIEKEDINKKSLNTDGIKREIKREIKKEIKKENDDSQT